MATKPFSATRALVVGGGIIVVFLGSIWRTYPNPLTINLESPNFNSTGQSRLCIGLATALPDNVYSNQHPDFLDTITDSFAAQAREETPECIVKPGSAQEVSVALSIIKGESDANRTARFAVRSGGHRPGRGHSSIMGGVLIDLGRINEVTISYDQRYATIGSGARWGQVYTKLDNMNLSIAGGRNSDVGVGGLALGGGISFFSPQVGMVCDNIVEYEMVLANGTILHASSSENPDLWKSLKGGSSNFGIVTRFVGKTFPATRVWAGYNYFPFWKVPRLVNAFQNFNKLDVLDEHAASPLLSLNYINYPPIKISCVNIIHTKPEKWPKAWSEFRSIWPRWSTARIRTIADAAKDLSRTAPRGKRQHYGTITVKNERETLQAIPTLFEESIEHVKTVKDLTWTIVLQPLPATITHKGSPNVLGLESRNASDPTPIIILFCPSWRLAEDDVAVIRAAQDLQREIQQLSVQRESADDYVYLNYAGDFQDPFKGYGKANEQFLMDTSRKYDPDRFFQQARAGGFKLDK